VMEALSSAAKAAPAKQRQAFQAMLAGFEPYSAEQLQGMWDGEAWLPQRWLEEWSTKSGGKHEQARCTPCLALCKIQIRISEPLIFWTSGRRSRSAFDDHHPLRADGADARSHRRL
jgi:hypothetical protein